MFGQFRIYLLCGVIASIMMSTASDAIAATRLVDCTKNGDLQKEVNRSASGDVIQIKGICMTNVVIRDKAVTLVGHSSAGPHGITGVAANTDGVRIENSRGTHLEGLIISNPHAAGVRLRFNSDVTMTDVEVSHCGTMLVPPGGTGIWVQEGSSFEGTRLRLDDNLRGLGAYSNSRAFCYECDLNDNTAWAASAFVGSTVSLLDSEVDGDRGLQANSYSYADIDCETVTSGHTCSLDAVNLAALASQYSTVTFYRAGDFSGRIQAQDRSQVQLLGARQTNNLVNILLGSSSLMVTPFFDGEGNEIEGSRLQGETQVNEFSQAVLRGDSTELDGHLICAEGGDAWVGPAVDLTATASISDCDHAP